MRLAPRILKSALIKRIENQLNLARNDNARLKNEIEEFNRERISLIDEIRNFNTEGMKRTTLASKVEIKTGEILVIDNQINKLKKYIRDTEEKFSDTIQAKIEKTGSNNLAFTEKTKELFIEINSQSPMGGTGIERVAKHILFDKDALKKGDVLKISVEGSWSPTCALERSRIYDNVENAETSSLGFYADGLKWKF